MSIPGWLKRLVWRRLDEDDFEDEVQAHLAIAAAERTAEGGDPRAARYAALREFGNVTRVTEAARQVWTPGWVDRLEAFASDVRYALRALSKTPAFSLTVIGVLTLGIGLNAAVFTMLKSMALNPLGGVAGASRLAVIYGQTGTGRQMRISYPDYLELRSHPGTFAQLMGSSFATLNLGRGRTARQISGELVTGNYFQVLGVGAQLGRTLLPSDEVAPGAHPVAVLSDGLWRRDFASDPAIVGKTIDVNNYRLTVVGVSDPAFHGTIVAYDVEVFLPVMMAAQIGLTGGLPQAEAANLLSDRRAAMLYPHGYLEPGTTLASAQTQVDAIWATLSKDRPLTDVRERLRLVPFRQSPTGGQSEVMPTLAVMSAMGMLVLLTACANIAGLMLVRGVSRRGEIAVRLALGATRTRIVRLLIVESLILAIPGTILGVLLASESIPRLVGYAEWLAAPQRLFFNAQIDRWVIGFAALGACASALVFGFVPALQGSRVDLVSVINADASPRGAARGRLRGSLVIAQVAGSLLLLVGAGLVTRSLDAARRANPGFDAQQVTAVEIDVKQNAYDEAHGRHFYRQLLDAARTDPGVESATLAAFTPLGFIDTRSQSVAVEGYEPKRGEDVAFMFNAVDSEYFRTLRIGVLAGRAFDDRDDDSAAPVVVVNRTLADRFWGGEQQALGKRLKAGDGPWRVVIGVAADVKYSRIDEAPRPYFYLPFRQAYRASMILHTRGTLPVDVLVAQARAHVQALDGEMPILSARPMVESIAGALIFMRLTAMMLFIFGVAGMGLAALGTYGLVSYAVRQSTHEIGIRMALGASAPSIIRTFLGRGLRLGAIGAVVGLVFAVFVGRMLSGVLFGVSATDATAYSQALVIVLGGVTLATLIPAWRAARTNPLGALRHQ